MDLIIRKMTETDLEPLFELLSDPLVMEYLEPPYTKEETGHFLRRAGLSNPPLIYAVENNDCFIGYVIYHDYDEDSVEIGWVLHPEYWGKGYASYLTERMIGWAFLSKKQLVIECSPKQNLTKHLAQKHGFSYIDTIDGLDVFRLKQ